MEDLNGQPGEGLGWWCWLKEAKIGKPYWGGPGMGDGWGGWRQVVGRPFVHDGDGDGDGYGDDGDDDKDDDDDDGGGD